MTTEHPPKTPRSTTGLFALLRGLLPVQGTGAPSPAPAVVDHPPTEGGKLTKPRSSHTSWHSYILAPLLALIALSVAASPALAARGHVYGSTFGSAGPGDAQFSEPEGIAVNEATGNLYIADKGNNRVEELTEKGEFVAAWGWGVSNGKSEYEVCTSACGAGLAGSGEGQFEWPSGGVGSIAVDNACKLREEATHIPLSASECETLDPSNGDVYVETGPYTHEMVDKFSATGAYLGKITGPASNEPGTFSEAEIGGLATDGEGNFYVLVSYPVSKTSGVDKFEGKAGNPYTGFTSLTVGGLSKHDGFAVDASGDLYVRYITSTQLDGEVAEFIATGHKVNGFVGGEAGGVGFNGVAVELSTGDVYIDHVTSVERLGPFEAATGANPLIERFGAGHLPDVSCNEEALCRGGVAVDSASGRIYVSEGPSDQVQEYTLEPPNEPVVQDQSVSDVTSGTAKLAGEVNPRSETFEEATSYWFEYTPVERFDREGWTGAARTSVERLAALYGWSLVSAGLVGLSPGTSYRYRLAASNALSKGSPSLGETRVFRTEPVAGFGLLDGRGWELVSPPDKLGALLLPLSPKLSVQASVQAAAGGGAVSYVASAPTEDGVASRDQVTQVFSSRNGSSGGWQSRDLAVPDTQAVLVAEHPVFPLFIGDLSRGAVQPLGPFIPCASPGGAPAPCLSSLASEQTAYVHDDFQGGGSSGEFCASSCFTPLVTAVNAPGVEFGIKEQGPVSTSDRCPPNAFCGPQVEAASPNLEHVVLESSVGLTEEGSGGGLFEWSEATGQLTFLGDGEVGAGGVDGNNGSFLVAGEHDVSADGSRVVFKGSAEGLSGLLLRDSVTGQVVQVGGPEATFVTASADDSKIFFTSEGVHSGQGAPGPLEECEVVEESDGELYCNTVDLSPGATVFAPLPGVSEDGSTVYFVSTSVLTGSEPSPDGEVARAGQPNLYLHKDGVTSFVAVLSSADEADWGDDYYLGTEGTARNPKAAVRELTARVSPDGRWLAFLSARSLTGFDNTDASTGQPDSEVYLYHAATGGEPASLICASCDPTGARPHGSSSVPAWSTVLYQSRYLSDGGRLFFDSPDALVSQDTNNTEDVYEYEPVVGATPGEESPSSDSCTAGASTYSTAAGGCVDLVSSGSSTEPSTFLDASENGDDVFFLTAAEISKRDVGTEYDVYDARVGGFEPEPVKPVECQGDACQSPVQAPSDLTPGSLTFTGPGDELYVPPLSKPAVKKKKIVKCPKGKVRNRHDKCVKAKPMQRKAKKTNRRTHS